MRQKSSEKSESKAKSGKGKVLAEKPSVIVRPAKNLSAKSQPEKIIPRKRKTGSKRQSEILDTARELIFCEGFGNFTIRTVAGRIGISEAAIYRHFTNKEELMLALLDFLFSPWRTAIQDLLESESTAPEKLLQLVELHLEHLLQKQLNPMLFFSEAIHPDNSRLMKGLHANLQFLHGAVTRIITHGQQNGEISRKIVISAAVVCAIGIMQNSVIKWTLARSEAGLLTEAQNNMRFFAESISEERSSK